MNEAEKLISEVRDLLINRPACIKIRTIAKDIKVAESWLQAFRTGKIANPGVLKLFALKEYLNNCKKN